MIQFLPRDRRGRAFEALGERLVDADAGANEAVEKPDFHKKSLRNSLIHGVAILAFWVFLQPQRMP